MDRRFFFLFFFVKELLGKMFLQEDNCSVNSLECLQYIYKTEVTSKPSMQYAFKQQKISISASFNDFLIRKRSLKALKTFCSFCRLLKHDLIDLEIVTLSSILDNVNCQCSDHFYRVHVLL